ncbi:MAG TPA: ABC transporter permease [Candidatus Gemmiger excrementigallinarum]|uniref:Transport permease protein n=1 Tax=Candidatus Gemmiger excrementigallinarum TaxID=2838609 RepID=A0A9D2JAD2_9FIRM|nr:ABC transporter permease [uncultured Subdoligranulum sp.]HIZ41499.1 ABC transporter permease [Candidatus Gemmiger excrementigallinarum]
MQRQPEGQLRTSWGHFKKYRPLIRELVTRDLKVKYRRSFLGYVWSILNPLLMMLLQTLVFSYMFRFDIPNYPLYLICGNTLFNFFNESTNMGMGSVLGNSSLIKKVYVPKFIFPISRVVSSFVNLLFSLVAIVLVMLITRSPIYPTLLLVWAPLLLLFLFCCGMALLLSALAVYFRDLQYLYGIVTMAWMYATPLFYPLSQLPGFMQQIVKLNPLYHYINCMRCLVMYGFVPGPNTWFACVACAVVMVVLGLAAFRKLQRNFILYL